MHRLGYSFTLELGSLREIELFNVTNVYRIGVHKHRMRNRPDGIAAMNMDLGDKRL
jgi:hypothetical protein